MFILQYLFSARIVCENLRKHCIGLSDRFAYTEEKYL